MSVLELIVFLFYIPVRMYKMLRQVSQDHIGTLCNCPIKPYLGSTMGRDSMCDMDLQHLITERGTQEFLEIRVNID